jgi:SNF2 family DNA or RNA helicase
VDEATILCNHENILWKMLQGGTLKKIKKDKETGRVLDTQIRTFDKLNKGAALLTATPINKPTDAYGLIKIVNPTLYRNNDHFRATHVAEYDFFGAPKDYLNLGMLQAALNLNSTVRAASDHLDLPDKVYNIIEYDLGKDHYDLYIRLMEERLLEYQGMITVDAIQATALYNAMQKIILHPEISGEKILPEGLEILDSVVNGVKQVLIVNKYNSTNQKLIERYKNLGTGGCFGGESRTKQTKAVQDFQAGKLRVLLTHPKSGGFGLNLQCCSQVVFPEIPVTARDFRQAEGRVYRQGQTERVIVTVLVARKTIQASLLKRIMDNDEITQEVLPTPKSLREDLLGG